MKIPKEVIKRKYELTYLLPAGYSQAEQEEVAAEIEAQVKKHKGQVMSSEVWGKKALAYRIKAHKKFHFEAVYVHSVLEFPSSQVQSFEKIVGLEPKLIRHLLVVAS